MSPKKPLRVLVIDDEQVIRDFLGKLLTLEGIEAETVEGGLEAIDLITKKSFDIIFVDMRMPKMSGVDALKLLKKASPKSKFVMMTGYSLDDLLKNVEGESIEAVITKPFEIKEIITILQDYERSRYPDDIADVLVVETEDMVLNFFKKLFQSYHVTAVKTGQQALEMILKQDFDLIVSDMALTDITGVELYAKIKEIRPDAKIILVSGDAKKTEGLVKDSLYLQIKNILNK